MKKDKIQQLLKKFSRKIIERFDFNSTMDKKRIAGELLNLFEPGGKVLTFMIFPAPRLGGRASGGASENVIYLKSQLTGYVTADDESPLPSDPGQAFAEIIKRRLRRILYHEFIHIIDGITKVFAEEEEKADKVKRAYYGKENKSAADEDKYRHFYASEYKEINARLLSAFAYFQQVDLKERRKNIEDVYKDYQSNTVNPSEASSIIYDNWNDIKDANSFLNYYRTKLGEYLTKNKRYYEYITDPKLLSHVDNRIIKYFNNVKTKRDWRYIEFMISKMQNINVPKL